MSTEDIKSNVTTSIAAPKKDVFDYSSELAQLKDTTELNELERPKTIGAYKLLIIRATQNYRARVLGELEKKIINIPGWEDVITDLVCLAGVIIDNFHKITNIDDLREFYQIFKVAEFSHQSVNEKCGDEEKIRRIKAETYRATNLTKVLVEQSIPRYAYILDMNEEQLRAKMAEKRASFNKSCTSMVKQEGGLVIDRTLKLRQATKEPAKMVPRGKIISIEERVQEESPIEYTRRRIQEESNLKKHLAYLLKMSYENIKAFEAKYQKYSDFRHNIQDISRTINPIIRNEKVRKMQEHLFKLERYHRTISSLYNTLYTIIIYQYDELSRDELIQIESLFLLYESMTASLRDCIGDHTIATLERRRIRLQEQITKYNGYIDQIIIERENGNPSYTGNIIPYGGNNGTKKA